MKLSFRSREGISPRRRKIGFFLIILMVTLGVIGGAFTGAITQYNITVLNSGATNVTDQVLAIQIGSQSLIDTGTTTSDMLNSHLHEGASDIADMPATPKINLVAAWADSTADPSVNETSAAADVLTNDLNLPYLQNDEYFFAFHNPARILHLQVSTKIVGDPIVLSWSYCDTSNVTTCTSWVAFTDVTDSTSNFTNDGKQTISWTIPAAGAWGKENHESTAGYWVRAKVTNNPASNTTPPKGSRSQYETGQWWSHTNLILPGQELDYQLYVGGTDMKTFHHYFPGFEGVVTADAVGLEPSNEWKFDIKQNFIIDTNESGKIINKTGSMDLSFQGAVTPGSNNTITLNAPGISSEYIGTWTHSEEDGTTGAYYSGTAEESYSKSFYNAASNYKTARQETSADILSNTSSEVVSHKIGQAYDKVIDTTAAFGAKLNDPS